MMYEMDINSAKVGSYIKLISDSGRTIYYFKVIKQRQSKWDDEVLVQVEWTNDERCPTGTQFPLSVKNVYNTFETDEKTIELVRNLGK